jgi:hypothetical protein
MANSAGTLQASYYPLGYPVPFAPATKTAKCQMNEYKVNLKVFKHGVAMHSLKYYSGPPCPNPSTPCGRATPSLPNGQAACGRLLPPWTPHARTPVSSRSTLRSPSSDRNCPCQTLKIRNVSGVVMGS